MHEDVIYLGSTPSNEDCAQVGSPDYPERSRAECRAFITAIKRVCGEPPEGARLTIKSESHDFGTYREVAIIFDGTSKEAADYADKVDRHAPATWEEADMVAPVQQGLGR